MNKTGDNQGMERRNTNKYEIILLFLMQDEFEYVIIGAGSTGASIAYHLSRSRKSILLIDGAGIAGGNTGKSSALIRTHYSNELVARMAKFSYGVISNFDHIGFSGFHSTGMIFPFDGKQENVVRKNVEMLRGLGLNEVEIEPAELTSFFPGLVLDNLDYVIYEPHSGYADPVAVTNSFVSASQANGVKLQPGNMVNRVDSDGAKVKVLLNDGTVVKGKKVILATNVWTNKLLGNSGISKDKLLPISASLHSVIYLKRPPTLLGHKPVLWDPPNLAYYKMEGESITALGSLDPEIDNTPVNIDDNLPETANYEYIEEYVGRITSRIPEMGKSTLVSSINGLYDMTPDGEAIISSLDYMGLDNVFVCAGLSGHGFKLSPAYGLIVSEMVSDIEPKEATFDWRVFTPERFKTGKLITSSYTGIGTIY
jgi:sarcosine oxidase subunit beta